MTGEIYTVQRTEGHVSYYHVFRSGPMLDVIIIASVWDVSIRRFRLHVTVASSFLLSCALGSLCLTVNRLSVQSCRLSPSKLALKGCGTWQAAGISKLNNLLLLCSVTEKLFDPEL